MITVLGSYGIAMTIKTSAFPVSGETVIGHDFAMLHGGKGANQAIGCARMGKDVFFYSCIGRDEIGEKAMELFAEEGIDVSAMRYSEINSTDVGLVMVDEKGDNRIIIQYSACNEITPEDIERLKSQIEQSDLVVTQFEMAAETVAHISQICKEVHTELLLNPAPYREAPEQLMKNGCAYITPNESEARQMLGLASDDSRTNEEIARMLLARGIKNVIMTMGEEGALIANEDGIRHIEGIKVDAVDTTGAGDTFTAALAVALSEGKALEEAVCFANAAGALAVTKYGVVEAIPYRKEVDALLDSRKQ